MGIAILMLFIGLALGAALGWLGRSIRIDDLRGALPVATEAGRMELERGLAPIHEAVNQLAGHIRGMEEQRSGQLASLTAQVQAMSRTSTRLTDRTDQLVRALRSPTVRGRWGEIQLERVLELGGMVEHCDFDCQVVSTAHGTQVKPDVIIHLSQGRSIIVDAKVPFGAYLDAIDSTDPEERAAFMRRHAHQLRQHVSQLSSRAYIEAFSPTPEFVVLFVPADPFLDSALRTDPQLLDDAFARDIVIATPTTLFALLRTVALTWRHDDFSDKAREIHRLGRELYSRLSTLTAHMDKVGHSLEKAIESYNSAVGSLDARVGVTARRLSEMGVPGRTTHTTNHLERIYPTVRRPRDVGTPQPRGDENGTVLPTSNSGPRHAE